MYFLDVITSHLKRRGSQISLLIKNKASVYCNEIIKWSNWLPNGKYINFRFNKALELILFSSQDISRHFVPYNAPWSRCICIYVYYICFLNLQSTLWRARIGVFMPHPLGNIVQSNSAFSMRSRRNRKLSKGVQSLYPFFLTSNHTHFVRTADRP